MNCQPYDSKADVSSVSPFVGANPDSNYLVFQSVSQSVCLSVILSVSLSVSHRKEIRKLMFRALALRRSLVKLPTDAAPPFL